MMYLLVKHAKLNQLYSRNGNHCDRLQNTHRSDYNKTNVDNISVQSFYSWQFFQTIWFKQTIKFLIILIAVADHISNIIVGIWLYIYHTNHNVTTLRWAYAIVAIIVALIQVLHLILNFRFGISIRRQRFMTQILIKTAMTLAGLVGYVFCLIPCFVIVNYSVSPNICCFFLLYPYIREHQTIYPLISHLIHKLHGLFVRVCIETIPFSCIMVSILANGCSCDDKFHSNARVNLNGVAESNKNSNNDYSYDSYRHSRDNGFICGNIVSIIYVSLCLKIINVLITVFIFRIAESRKISFHTQLSNGFICVAEITRFLCSLGIIFLVYWLRLDKYYILLQVYIIPTFICITILTIFECMHKNKMIFVFPGYLIDTSISFFKAFNVKTVAFDSHNGFLEDTTWDRIHCTVAMRSHSYYSILNKISYLFANYRYINSFNISQNIQLNQQIGCINYQIINYCNQYLECHQKETFPTSIHDWNKTRCLLIKSRFVQIEKELEQSLHTQQFCNAIKLMETNSLEKDMFPLTNSLDIFFFAVIHATIHHKYVTKFCNNYHYPGEFSIVAISFIISRIIGIMFPFYWWLFIDYTAVDKQLQDFVSFCLYSLAVLYITTGWVLVRYRIPLFYKMKHVLSTQMILPYGTDSYYPKAVRHLIGYCFRKRKPNVFLLDKMDDKLLNASMMQFKALQSRPVVEQVLCIYFGKDLGGIIYQYVPVWDQSDQRRMYRAWLDIAYGIVQVKTERPTHDV